MNIQMYMNFLIGVRWILISYLNTGRVFHLSLYTKLEFMFEKIIYTHICTFHFISSSIGRSCMYSCQNGKGTEARGAQQNSTIFAQPRRHTKDTRDPRPTPTVPPPPFPYIYIYVDMKIAYLLIKSYQNTWKQSDG